MLLNLKVKSEERRVKNANSTAYIPYINALRHKADVGREAL